MNVLGIGFNCVDIIRTNKNETLTAGGTCTNVLAILSSLGIETTLMSPNYYENKNFKLFIDDITNKNINHVLFKKTTLPFSIVIQDNSCKDHKFITTCPKCGESTINTISFNEHDAKKYVHVLNNVDFLYCDRFSQGIKYFVKICHDKGITTFYEPNNCRFYNTQLSAIKNFDIVKFSSSRINEKTAEKLRLDLGDSRTKLIIVTLGNNGLKFSVRQNNVLSDWIEIKKPFENDVVDSSGAGDCLTAALIYSILSTQIYDEKKYNISWLQEVLYKAQIISSINCNCLGAQGFLYNDKALEKACAILKANKFSVRYEYPQATHRIRCSNCNNIL